MKHKPARDGPQVDAAREVDYGSYLALDELLATGPADDGTGEPAESWRSVLNELKADAGAISILSEIAKLERLRSLALSSELFGDVSLKVVERFRQFQAGMDLPHASERKHSEWTLVKDRRSGNMPAAPQIRIASKAGTRGPAFICSAKLHRTTEDVGSARRCLLIAPGPTRAATADYRARCRPARCRP